MDMMQSLPMANRIASILPHIDISKLENIRQLFIYLAYLYNEEMENPIHCFATFYEPYICDCHYQSPINMKLMHDINIGDMGVINFILNLFHFIITALLLYLND